MLPTNDSPNDKPLDPNAEPADSTFDELAEYPYTARIQPMQLPKPPGCEEQLIRVGFLRFQPPTPAQYMVPRRFGMSAILGIMTALAILFGAFHLLNAPPGVYLFFGLQTLVICIAQMLNSNTPRLASSVAGAILVPVFLLPILLAEMRHLGVFDVVGILVAMLVFGIPTGAFLGYLTGTCAAGIFLVMDYLEPYLQGQGRPSRSANV
jgi:hypothetical protein